MPTVGPFPFSNSYQKNGVYVILGADEKSPPLNGGLFLLNFGDDLLSHAVSHAVPSALKSLTTVFGMGTGVTSSL